MSPATRRIVIPLIVTVVALSVVAVGIVGKRNAADPAKTTPEPPTEVADASSESAAAPSTATPEAADAPGADPASDVSPAIDPVALGGLRAVARGGPFGHETPPAMRGSLEPGDDARMLVEFSRAGAGIAKITFSDVWISADARRQADRYVAAVAAGRSTDGLAMPSDDKRYVLKQSQRLANQRLPQGLIFPAVAAIAIEIEGEWINLFDYNDVNEDGEVSGDEYIWAEIGPGAFQTVVVNEDGDDVLRIQRRFVLGPDYDLTIEQRIENLTGMPLDLRWRQQGPGTLALDRSRYMDRRRWRFGYVTAEELAQPLRGTPFVMSDKDDFLLDRTTLIKRYGKAMKVKNTAPSESLEQLTLWPTEDTIENQLHLTWFGSTNRYFTFTLHPPVVDGVATAFTLDPLVERALLEVSLPAGAETDNEDKIVFTTLDSPAFNVAAASTHALDVGAYVGPLDRRVLDDQAKPYRSLSMQGLILYQMSSWCGMCTFQWLAHLLLGFLSFLHSYVLFDWGLAIIFLVVVVRTLLHPITKRSQIAMQRFGKVMQAIRPEMDKLQKKYPNDPRKLQQEQLRMMREHGVNPLHMLGCLPMFLQMPIWVALYAMLYFAYDIRQVPGFFGIFQKISGGHWHFLGDLSSADHFFWMFDEPFRFLLWNVTGVNILPILMGVIFFVQQKYMSPPPSATMSKDQLQQQKLMRGMMVVMFPLLMYSAPSGLTLYILTSSCIGVLESRYVRRHVSEMDLTAKKPVKKKAKPKDAQGRAYAKAIERMEQKRKQRQKGPPKSYKKKRR